MSSHTISYRFAFPNGRAHIHEVEINTASGKSVVTPSPLSKPWTALENHQCTHCPLSKNDFSECPVAERLAVVAKDFSNENSYDEVSVEVKTEDRTYFKTIPLQEGLFSLFGLLMATSDCPYFKFLKPMARFHLPFSSLTETMVRSTSFYLLKQYFVNQKGERPDFDLVQLQKNYSDIEKVNAGIIDRIQSISKADADTNSLIILDMLGRLLSEQIEKKLADLEEMFR